MRRRNLALVFLLAVAGALATGAFAVSSFDVQTNNPQVAGDATSNGTARFPTNKSNEPSIAVNPTNPGLLVAGANDEQLQPRCGPGPVRGASASRNDCSFFPGVGSDGAYTSADGGATWTNRGLLPGFSDSGGSLVSDGDPELVYGPKPDGKGGFTFAGGARVYYAGLASTAPGFEQGNQAPEFLTVSRSDDNGVSWSNPVLAVDGHGFNFNDHPEIWADRNPSSPLFGRVYLAWTDFRSIPSTASPAEVAFSADGGLTWSAPNQLSPAYNNRALGGRQDAYVATGPDGAAYVFEDQGDAIVFWKSTDGGVKWSHAKAIATFVNLSDPIPGANFRDASYPSAAIDQNTGTIYVAWADASTGSGRIMVSKSTDGGAAWSTPVVASNPRDGYAFFQGLDVAPNGRVDLAYQGLKAKQPSTYGIGNASIDSFYTSSGDGVHWSASARVSSVSSDPAATAQNNLERQFWGDYNTLVSSNTAAWFTYTDSRNGQDCAAVDAYQHGIDGSGTPMPKPAPQDVCPTQFGNSDTFVSIITP